MANPAYFETGGRLALNSPDIVNRYSWITAAGAVQTPVGAQVQNIGQTLNRVTTQVVQSLQTTISTKTERIGTLDAVFSSNQPLSLNLRSLQNGAVTAGVIVPDQGGASPKSSLDTGGRTLDPLSAGYQLPDSGLFHPVTRPDAHYLVETDPRFTRYANFVSSDSMLKKLGFDPSTLQKRLGDGYYEQQLVSQAIEQKTGQRYLQGFNNGNQQYQALLDNGAAVASELKLTPGVALSADQVKSLTQDMVWLVSRTVNGEQVLVPEVYLAANDGARERSQGAVLAGQTMALQVDGALVNNGTLHADGDLVAKANDITMQGGAVDSGGNLALSASQDLTVAATGLNVRGSAALGAGRDLAITGRQQQYTGSGSYSDWMRSANATFDISQSQASRLAVGGDLQLLAGNDFTLSGSGVAAGGAIDVSAGRNLSVTSTVDHANDSYRIDSSWISEQRNADHQQQTLNQASLQGGNNVTLHAGNDLALAGADVQSLQGAVGAVAGHDVQLSDVVTANHDHRFDGWTWDMADGGERSGSDATHHGSTLKAATGLQVLAGNDLSAQAAALSSTQGTADLQAGRDLSLAAAVDSSSSQHHTDYAGRSEGVYNHSERLAQSQVQAQGGVSLQAGRDIGLNATSLAADQGAVVAQAGNDIKLTTTATHNASGWWDHGGSRGDQSDVQQNGASVGASTGLAIAAGQDLIAQAASLTTKTGAASLSAGRDLILNTAVNVHDDYRKTVSESGGLFSSTTTTDIVSHHNETDVGSTVSADSIALNSGRDLTILAGQVAGSNDVGLQAKRNLTIAAGNQQSVNYHYHEEKTSGMFSSGGLGVTIGVRDQSLKENGTENAAIASTVGSIKGNVSINAGQNYLQSGSQIASPNGNVDILGKNVAIQDARDTSQNETETRFKQSGVTVEITSPILSALQSVQQMKSAASQTSDPRMQALAAATAAMSAQGAYGGVKDALAKNESLAQASGVNLSISLGTSQSRSNSVQTSDHAATSTVTAGGNVKIGATGDGANSDLTIRASDVNAKGNIDLSADHAINLLAAQNTDAQHSSNKNFGASVGFSIGTSGLLFNASVSGGRGHADGTDVTWINSHVAAGDQLALTSGGDTTLKGAVASGNQVAANVGGNLNIESLQDTSHYDSQQQSFGGSISVGAGMVSGSVSMGNSKINSDYASVTEQSGIQAGDNGFQVAVNGNTDLKGAVIASTDTAVQTDKNSFVTGGTLTMSNLQNHADYQGDSFQVGLGCTMQTSAPKPTSSTGQASSSQTDSSDSTSWIRPGQPGSPGSSSGIGSDGGSASSTTYAGISGIAGNTAVRTGDPSSGIGKIFDADKVQREINAQVMITQQFSGQASTALTNYVASQRKDLQLQFKNTKDLELRAQIQGQINKLNAEERMMNVLIGVVTGQASVAATQGVLSEAADLMRQETIHNSTLFAGITDGKTTLSNLSGPSEGVQGDEQKAGGTRVDLDNICGPSNQRCFTNSDGSFALGEKKRVQFDVQNAHMTLDQFLSGEGQKVAGLTGGIQGEQGTMFGVPYSPGGVVDHWVESFAGPHDFIGGEIVGLYDTQGNIQRGMSSTKRTAYDVWTVAALVPAAPFATASALPPQVWNAISLLLQSVK